MKIDEIYGDPDLVARDRIAFVNLIKSDAFKFHQPRWVKALYGIPDRKNWTNWQRMTPALIKEWFEPPVRKGKMDLSTYKYQPADVDDYGTRTLTYGQIEEKHKLGKSQVKRLIRGLAKSGIVHKFNERVKYPKGWSRTLRLRLNIAKLSDYVHGNFRKEEAPVFYVESSEQITADSLQKPASKTEELHRVTHDPSFTIILQNANSEPGKLCNCDTPSSTDCRAVELRTAELGTTKIPTLQQAPPAVEMEFVESGNGEWQPAATRLPVGQANANSVTSEAEHPAPNGKVRVVINKKLGGVIDVLTGNENKPAALGGPTTDENRQFSLCELTTEIIDNLDFWVNRCRNAGKRLTADKAALYLQCNRPAEPCGARGASGSWHGGERTG